MKSLVFCKRPGACLTPARTAWASEAVLLNQYRLPAWNFTQLSLSSKTQWPVPRTVTRGSGFTGCCHTKRIGPLL